MNQIKDLPEIVSPGENDWIPIQSENVTGKVKKSSLSSSSSADTINLMGIPEATTLNPTDYFLIYQDGGYKKILASKISSSGTGGTGGTSSTSEFTYSSAGDANGIFYHLGLNPSWTNPHTEGAILLSASSIFNQYGYGDISNLVARNTASFATNDASGSWIKMDLKSTHALKLKRYTLRSQADSNSNPRNWKMQGSNDNTTWTDLDTQTGNTILTSSSWYISAAITPLVAYRYFRLLQTGTNSNGGNYFILGEVELYGELTTT